VHTSPGGARRPYPCRRRNRSRRTKNAPHTAAALLATDWPHAYTRDKAAFPRPYVRAAKFWPSVGRLNNVLGDRKLFCSCPPIEDYT
jgi:glycine dehydrogenase